MSGSGTATRPRASEMQAAGDRSETQRAEELVEDWSERAAGWVSLAVARTREEIEDVWAEAQAVRRGDR